MKVYEIKLRRHDVFAVYRRDNIVTLVTDEKHPYPCTIRKWNKQDDQISDDNDDYRKKHFLNPVAVPKEEMFDFLCKRMPRTIQSHLDIVLLDRSMFLILTKDWNDFVEVGFFVVAPYANSLEETQFSEQMSVSANEAYQQIADSYLSNKAFW